MIKAYLVCESSYDEKLLGHLLSEKFQNNNVVTVSGGKFGAPSLARSLAVRRQLPVIILVNAETTDQDKIVQKKLEIQAMIDDVAAHLPLKVSVATPTLEAIFFQDTKMLSRILGIEISDDMVTEAKDQPKKVLGKAIAQSEIIENQEQLVECLTKNDIEILCTVPVVKKVIDFFESRIIPTIRSDYQPM